MLKFYQNIFYKKQIIVSAFDQIQIEQRVARYLKNKWPGTGYVNNKKFLLVPKLEWGVFAFFRVYIQGAIFQRDSTTEIKIEYKVNFLIKAILLILFIGNPIVFFIKGFEHPYLIFDNVPLNVIVFIVIPFLYCMLSKVVFNNQCRALEKKILTLLVDTKSINDSMIKD
jgi:hypothetical protein